MKQGIRARGTRQKARVERFEELKESKLHLDDNRIDMNMSGKRLGNKIMEIDSISKSFGDKTIIKDFSYRVQRQDRIGILGDNGAGKSTLMNIIAGRLEADTGQLDIGETVKIGYFSQEAQDMDPELKSIEYIATGGEIIENEDGSYITAAQLMENFLFTGSEQWTPIGKLSGGEKRRLYLLKVLMENPNFLILDEPTNDLDIATLTILEDYIDNFNGPVLIVSHDRYFLDKLVNTVLHIEDGRVEEFSGNYSDFQEYQQLLRETQIQNESKEVGEMDKGDNYHNRNLKFSYNEKREWATIAEDIKELEDKIKSVDLNIEKYTSDYNKLNELLEDKDKLEAELDEKMERWIYLSDLQEQIDNQ